MNSEDKNQQMILSLQRFPDKYLWLEQNSHTVEQKQKLNWITEVPTEIFCVRRLDRRKCHPAQKY